MIAHELGTGQEVVIVLYAERAKRRHRSRARRAGHRVRTDVLTEQQSFWGTVSQEEITINNDTYATHQK